jgi:hypothetical protein
MRPYFLKQTLIILFLHLISFSIKAQFCTNDDRFSNVAYFTDSQISSQLNVPFANVTDWQGNNETLKLDVYYPTLAIDTLPLRPLILMVHGGGLVSGNKVNYSKVCQEFAKRGFVAATINYRLGLNCNNDSISEEKAKYRAQQDINSAFRFVVENASALRVDTSWMFIGGGSAGSVAALGVVYISQAEWNNYTPSLQGLLGNLNSSGNNLTNTFDIKGVFNDWGGMLVSSMQVSEMLPMVSFHGDADNTVSIDSAYGGGCYQVEKAYGSRAMHNLLLANGICSDLSVKAGGGHGVFNDSIFGIPFRVGRAACFFKSLFCDNCTSFYQVDSVEAQCSQTVNVSTNLPKSDYIVFPNPFSDRITISNQNGDETFTLTDNLGHLLFLGKNIETENFTFLEAGTYFLKIDSSKNSKTIILLKE